nr:DUF1743 domain-containing protein [Euryarchaeota archaeon]
MGWLGLDDTDGLTGGCTTHTFHKIISILTEESANGANWGSVRDARLVRLWPFAPRRTRGNAAVACEILLSGENEGNEVEIEKSEQDLLLRLNQLWQQIVLVDAKANGASIESEHDSRLQSKASPGMVWFNQKIPDDFYWRAVREKVSLDEAMQYIASQKGSKVWTHEDGHGCIGALAAISWKGIADHTWETTAYRLDKNIGIPRLINNNKVADISSKFPQTFVNRDPTSGRTLISPRTPCPVLFGIRSESFDSGESAARWLLIGSSTERVSGMRIWRTNQATDDHLSNSFEGRLHRPPNVMKGGHTTILVKNTNSNSLQKCIAFSQSGDIRLLMQMLVEGDEVRYFGLADENGDIHLEKICFTTLSHKRRIRPLCPCGTRFSSKGKGQNLKCPKCANRHIDSWIEGPLSDELTALVGKWLEPPASARRHLAAPITRLPPN